MQVEQDILHKFSLKKGVPVQLDETAVSFVVVVITPSTGTIERRKIAKVQQNVLCIIYIFK